MVMINLQLIINSLPQLLKGMVVSLEITAAALLIGFTLGTLLGIAQLSKNYALTVSVSIWVTIIRGTPMLIQIVFLYYVLSVTGLSLSPFFAAVVAIGINSSAYVSQIIKAGILAVPYGQIEAARTLGISKRNMLSYVILPQALRVALPALGNESITLVKDSSLASLIGVMELYKQGQTVISQTYDALSVYCIVGILYLIMTTTLSLLVSVLEKRLNRHVKHFTSF